MKFQDDTYILQVNEKPKIMDSSDLQKLSKAELEKYESIKNEKRKVEFALSRCMLRDLLGSQYSEIQYEESGKPTIANGNISISHCDSQVAVILSKTHTVAVDIEEYRQQIFRVTSKFVRADEQNEFSSLEDLILLWCAKETIFKLTNASYDFLEFEVHKNDDGLVAKVNIAPNILQTIKLSYFRNEKFCLVWAIEKTDKQ